MVLCYNCQTKNYVRLSLIVHYFSLQIYHVQSKYLEGFLQTSQNWAFITRFCFYSEVGTFRFIIQYPMDYATQNLLLYYDEPHQWRAVYKTDKTCSQKEEPLSRGDNQIISLAWRKSLANCTVVSNGPDDPHYRCSGYLYFITARERWWFISISNCNSSKGLKLKYWMNMQNDDEHNYWFAQFSADEFYILPTDIAFFIANLLLLILASYSAFLLNSRKMLHSTYKLFLASICCQLFGLFLLMMAYLRYAKDGVGLPTTKLWGQVFLSLSTILLLLLVLLIAKGYTVTRGRLRRTSSIRLSVFMSLYCLTYVVLFIYQQEVFDPGEVLYLHESPAGYGLVVLRLIGWGMFLYAIVFTLKHHPQKGNFYYQYFMLYSSWFLTGPFIIIIANNLIDKWVREKVVNGIELAVSFCGHCIFLVLTRPSVANKNFPFHIRTTQIHAMEINSSEDIGECTLDNFSRHPYEVPKDISNNNIVSSLALIDSVCAEDMIAHSRRPKKENTGINSTISNANYSSHLVEGPISIPSAPPLHEIVND